MGDEKPTLHRASTMEQTAQEAKEFLADVRKEGRTRGEKKVRSELSVLFEPAASEEVLVTQEELDAYRKQLVNIFRHIDRNGDGKLDETEMFALLQSVGKRATKRQVTLLMRQLDTDKNGTIDLQEFEDFMLQKKNYKLLEEAEEEEEEAEGDEEEEEEEATATGTGKKEADGPKAAASASDEPKPKRRRQAGGPPKAAAKPRKPATVASALPTSIGASSSEMQQAYELGGLLVKDRLSEEERALLSRAPSDAVMVIPGGADHAEQVVKALEIPTQVLPLASMGPLRGDQILIINCCGHVTPADYARIGQFVRDGGLLITTDHALDVAAGVFPGYIKKSGSSPPPGDVAINHRSTDPLVRGFWDEDIDPTWRVDGGAYPIEIVNHEAVSVLLASDELKAKCGQGAVMVAFQPASTRGRVVHIISHIYVQKQQSRLRGGALRLASEYAEKKGGSLETLTKIRNVEGSRGGGLAFEQVQSASTAMDFVLQALLAQLRREGPARQEDAPASIASMATDSTATSTATSNSTSTSTSTSTATAIDTVTATVEPLTNS